MSHLDMKVRMIQYPFSGPQDLTTPAQLPSSTSGTVFRRHCASEKHGKRNDWVLILIFGESLEVLYDVTFRATISSPRLFRLVGTKERHPGFGLN